MSKPDIQYFAEDGTWVKPPGAVRADVVLQSAGGGGSRTYIVDGPLGGSSFPSQTGIRRPDGDDGQLIVQSFAASDLPDTVPVYTGKGGRPGGRDGYALIVTHLDGEQR